jgi:primosomal replication protein N
VTDNQLVLTGTVSRKPVTRSSPAGIPISRFGLEHRSLQQEAGGERTVQCWIRVVASGKPLQDAVRRLETGSQVRVTGFLARRSHRDPGTELELHALRIDCLD